MVAIRSIILGLLLVGAAGCPDRRSSDGSRFLDGANSTTPEWVIRQPATEGVRRPALVFVHGIFGDTIGTWTHSSGTRFFDLLDAAPGIAGRADMLAVGFPSAMFQAGAFDIREAANRLHLYLDYHRVLDYDTIVFVAHSMGGLVVMRELLTRRELMPKVPLVVFLGTPQEGAQIASIARHVLNNPALADMSEADGNALLQTLSDEWNATPPNQRPHVRCAYEDRDTFGVRIVPWASATRFCEGAPPAIPANHIDIVKPSAVDDDAVAVVTTALREYVFIEALTPVLETPDFLPEGDHLVLNLTDAIGRQSARLVNAGGASFRFLLTEISNPLLYLWPQGTQELGPRSTDYVHVALGLGAIDDEYRFILRTDVWPDREVVVRVADLQALRSQRQQLLETVPAAVNSLLADSGSLQEAAPDDRTAPAALARAVRQQVAALAPALPEGAQWVLTAEIFNATNWSALAAVALREAEAASPDVASDPAVRHLAAATSWYSGETRIFTSAATPLLNPREVAALPDQNLLVGDLGIGGDRAAELATQLQGIPALRVYGMSLRGDAMASIGNVEAAEASYSEAQKVRPTPSVSRRMEAIRDR